MKTLALVITLLFVGGCSSPKVLIPARVDLSPYGTLAIVTFESNAEGNLGQYATHRFMSSVQRAQSGATILELGDEAHVLEAIGHSTLDFEAFRAIGKKWGVDAVFAGELLVTEVKPKVQLASLLKSMSLSADVKASLRTRLVETGHGATRWTRSSSGKAQVAHVNVLSGGGVRFGATDPEEAYGDLVHGLVGDVTTDFYARWERR